MAVYRGSRRRRSVLVLLVLTSITLITLDVRGSGGAIGSVRNGARDALAPVQRAVDDIFTPVGDWFDGVIHRGALERDNVKLRRELADARGQAAQAKSLVDENQQLKALDHLTFLGGVSTVAADVVQGTPGNFESTVAIDRGTDGGVRAGMPVVAGDGLVGRITQASRRQATVQLLTDADSGIAVRLQVSDAPAVADGHTGSALLSLNFVSPDVTVTKGELVFTAGLDNGAFPAGIPVGKVVSVSKNANSLTQEISVKPLVDVSRISFVRVMRWEPSGPKP